MAARLTRNVITRYRSATVIDDAQRKGTLAEVGHNLFADVPEPVYEKTPDVPELAPGDRRLDTFSQLRLKAPAATQVAATLDDQLLRRELTVTEVRDMWFDAYQPRPDSPLTTTDPDVPLGPRTTAVPLAHHGD